MSRKPIVRIEHNDDDLRMKDKVNANFLLLAQDGPMPVVPVILSGTVSFSENLNADSVKSSTVWFDPPLDTIPLVMLTSTVSAVNPGCGDITKNGFNYAIRNVSAAAISTFGFRWIAMVV